MKRGFLNSPKARLSEEPRQAGNTPSPQSSSTPKETGGTASALNLETPEVTKALEEESEQLTICLAPGDHSEHRDCGGPVDLHKPPKKVLEKLVARRDNRKRFVFRQWPRDPKGKNLLPSTRKGDETSNGIDLWGATLYDFFSVRRVPGVANYLTTSTGSKLAAAMRELGELGRAKDDIAWADQSEKPQQIFPCNMGLIIGDQEHLARSGLFDKFSMASKGKEQNSSDPVAAFDHSNYPHPWPFVPFTQQLHKLQQRIPLRQLPRKLVVHDPWNLLSLDQTHKDTETPWSEKKDIIRHYELELSEERKKKVAEETDAVIWLNAIKALSKNQKPFVLLSSPNYTSSSPVIKAYYPNPPLPPVSIPEAHLYISRNNRSGTGNHSVVYQVEWELPRELLVEEKLCQACLIEAVVAESEKPPISEHFQHPGVPSDLKGKGKATAHSFIRIHGLDIDQHSGPVIEVHPDIHWQNPSRAPYCSHLNRGKNNAVAPPTSKVLVVAKLSIQHDQHLAREAVNYQNFPAHFSEHWNGYNIVPPLHDPVPVGAVVPQFYGYYVPSADNDVPEVIPASTNNDDAGTKDVEMKSPASVAASDDGTSTESSQRSKPYLSPILLLEDCGSQIDPHSMNMDDRQECAALVYKFHHAGWIHGSFAARNILVQPGPITMWPPYRRETIFRLIDFGRSFEYTDQSAHRSSEEMTAARLLGVHTHISPAVD